MKFNLLKASNMTNAPCVCTKLKRRHPGMYSLILSKFKFIFNASEFLTFPNTMR